MGLDIEMIARVPRKLTADEVKRVAVRMQIAFGRDSILWMEAPSERGDGFHCLALVDNEDWRIDDAGIVQAGCSYVRLNTLGRYYGPGYTRGNLVQILAVARFLRTALNDATVFYGSDSGGTLMPLDEEREHELWSVFTSEHSRDYFNHTKGDETTTVCDFCEVRTNTHTFSADHCITSCPSCGRRWKWERSTRAHVLIGKEAP